MKKRLDHRAFLNRGTRLGSYTIDAFVGEGAAALIYHMLNDQGESFAAKILRPSLTNEPYVRDKFLAESRILSRLDHPNILTYVEALEIDRLLIAVFEYVEGSNLDEYLPLHQSGLSEVLTFQIARQVTEALVYASGQGVIHRDLKPANILLRQQADGSLQAVVADFGLAKAMGSTVKTQTGMRIGTMAYMAPEQIKDSSRVDQRTDIYAMGVTLYECLTGALPFPYQSVLEMMKAQLGKAIPSVRHHHPDLSPEWDEIIAKACAKEREDRYQSAQEMLDALLRFGHKVGFLKRSTTALPPCSQTSPTSTQQPSLSILETTASDTRLDQPAFAFPPPSAAEMPTGLDPTVLESDQTLISAP